MSVVSKAVLFAKLVDYFARDGCTVEEVADLSSVTDLVAQMEKPYLSSFGSPDFNDFTQTNVLWLVLRKNGEPVSLGCARLEEIGEEPFGNYLRRLVKRHHGPQYDFERVHAEVDAQLSGRLAYFGDLFVAKGARGNLRRLRAFLTLGHLAVSLKWNPDWTYCFIREAHIMRGSAALYGFTKTFCQPIEWQQEPPLPRTASDWLVALPRAEVMSVAQNTVKMVCEAR